MRKTIKELEGERDRALENASYFRDKFNELLKYKEEKEQDEKFSLMTRNKELNDLGNKLMEVIRWNINPETARSPFMPTKDERENKRDY